jgi:hypothetical protein
MTLIQLHLPSPIITLAGSKLLLYFACYDPGSKIGEKSTFPIGVGRKQGDHELVKQLFAKELQSLCCGNCSFFNKKNQEFCESILGVDCFPSRPTRAPGQQ